MFKRKELLDTEAPFLVYVYNICSSIIIHERLSVFELRLDQSMAWPVDTSFSPEFWRVIHQSSLCQNVSYVK